jgi:hypothetical protein
LFGTSKGLRRCRNQGLSEKKRRQIPKGSSECKKKRKDLRKMKSTPNKGLIRMKTYMDWDEKIKGRKEQEKMVFDNFVMLKEQCDENTGLL